MTGLEQLRRFVADRQGAIAVTMAMLLAPTLMTIGAAVDYARLEQFKSQLQATVDTAALAGAAAYTAASQSSKATTIATNYMTSGVAGLPGHVGTITPSISAAQVTSGSNPGNTVTVAATGSIGTTFMRMFATTLSVSASASAVNPTKKVCILITDPSSSQSLLINSGVTIDAPNCEIDVASTSSSAAMIDSSLSNIAALCVAGGATVNGGASVTDLTTGCTTATNPYSGTITAPTISTTCTVNGGNYSGTTTLSPGTYCGSLNFNGGGTVTFTAGNYVFYNTTVNFNSTGTLQFDAGVYSLKDTHLNINSGWTATGSGVTFYYADASSYIQFNSGVKLNLSAPTTGTYANVLMFEPSGLATSSFAVDGNSTSDLLQGLIDLPSRNITFNSTTNVDTDGMTLVAHQVIFDATKWNFSSSPETISGNSGGTPRLAS